MPRTAERRTRVSSNLSAEFFVASQLLRLGHTATLTLGQTKEIDLLVETRGGAEVTIDVKGLKNRTNWPLRPKRVRPNHFYVLVAYSNRFDDPKYQPEVFVVPSTRIRRYLGRWSGTASGQTGVQYRKMKGSKYEDAWRRLDSVGQRRVRRK